MALVVVVVAALVVSVVKVAGGGDNFGCSGGGRWRTVTAWLANDGGDNSDVKQW